MLYSRRLLKNSVVRRMVITWLVTTIFVLSHIPQQVELFEIAKYFIVSFDRTIFDIYLAVGVYLIHWCTVSARHFGVDF